MSELMSGPMQIRFFLSDRRHPVVPTGRLWEKPLPQAPRPDSVPHASADLSYGQYFTAVRHFLLQEAVQARLQAAAAPVEAAAISGMAVYLEKHGQYYHPARIEVAFGDQIRHFVLHVAVAEAGRDCLRKDIRHMQRLRAEYPYSFLPKMYCFSDVDATGPTLSVAVGEWLTGFYEFHLSADSPNGRQTLVVWDPDRGRTRLSATLTQAVYRQAAKILAAYLNLGTFEHIRHWHHAAGDFVVRRLKDRVQVRLVTVRDYAPLFQNLEITLENVFELLILYLVQTALRLGLDRLDGTGNSVWAGSPVVRAAVAGTLDGLRLQAAHGIVPNGLVNGFAAYIKGYPAGELKTLCREMIVRWPPDTIGRDLMLARAASVATGLHGAIGHLDDGW